MANCSQYFLSALVLIALGSATLVHSEEELQHSHIGSHHHVHEEYDDAESYWEDHESDEEEFDHEVVVGSRQQAREFHSLTAEEAKRRLTEIVKQIDSDSSGAVHRNELLEYLKQNLRKLDLEAAETDFAKHNKDTKGVLSWSEYVLSQYGYSVEQIDKLVAEEYETSRDFLEMVEEDKARWAVSDLNKDGDLDLDEFASFLAPYNYAHTQDYEVDRVLGEFDDSVDGSIDLSEFEAHEGGAGSFDATRRFAELDKNADGRLQRDEVRDWVAPGLQVTAELETQHLFELTDPDAQDDQLKLADIVDHHEIWVGGHADAHAGATGHTEL